MLPTEPRAHDLQPTLLADVDLLDVIGFLLPFKIPYNFLEEERGQDVSGGVVEVLVARGEEHPVGEDQVLM